MSCDDKEKNKRNSLVIKIVAIAVVVFGFIVPFIPNFIDFQWWNPQIFSYLPPLEVSIFYIIIVGIPSLIYIIYRKKFEIPFLEYIGIYTGIDPTDYSLVLSSTEYREKFIALNGSDCVKSGAGLRRFNFDPITLCFGLFCFGLFMPIVVALAFHIIMG